MVGIIEHQQGLSHSALVEKLQQVKQDNLTVYQQYTAEEIQQKNAKKQQEVNESPKPEDIRVSDNNKKERRQKKNTKNDEQAKEENETNQKESIHLVDIIV